MAKQSLQQTLSQKLVPRQIQLMKLIQLSQLDMEARIREELEENPALELSSDRNADESSVDDDYDQDLQGDLDMESVDYQDDLEAALTSQYDYTNDDEPDHYGYQLKTSKSFIEQIQDQLFLNEYNEQETLILKYLLGSLNEEGYLELSIDQINDELAFKEGVFVENDTILSLLKDIQRLEPLGIGARDLHECLLLQLIPNKNKDDAHHLAYEIVKEKYEWLTRRNYDQIMAHFDIDEEALKEALQVITSLNPKPGLSSEQDQLQQDTQIIPDFLAVNVDGHITIYLINDNAVKVRLSSDFEQLLETVDDHPSNKKELSKTKSFIHKNIDNAKWFLEALEMRKKTLLNTMQAIADYQKDFLITGDETTIKPLILKTIAEQVQLDISTISRVVSSKYVQTEYGIIPLKKFFSDFVMNTDGEEVAVVKIKNQLQKIINEEDKSNPYNDEQLTHLLNQEGYTLARRTIAKYREQLQIPVATLRKEL